MASTSMFRTIATESNGWCIIIIIIVIVIIIIHDDDTQVEQHDSMDIFFFFFFTNDNNNNNSSNSINVDTSTDAWTMWSIAANALLLSPSWSSRSGDSHYDSRYRKF
jgi:hypothetical protein